MKMASSVHYQPAFTKHDDSYAFNENVFYKLLRGLKRIFQCGLIFNSICVKISIYRLKWRGSLAS